MPIETIKRNTAPGSRYCIYFITISIIVPVPVWTQLASGSDRKSEIVLFFCRFEIPLDEFIVLSAQLVDQAALRVFEIGIGPAKLNILSYLRKNVTGQQSKENESSNPCG